MDVQQILNTYGGLPPSAFTLHTETSPPLAAHTSIHGFGSSAVYTNTDNMYQPNQAEVDFSSQLSGSMILTETFIEDSNHNLSHSNHVQTGIEHAAGSTLNNAGNLDKSVFRPIPTYHDTWWIGNNLRHIADLHAVNCQAQSEHPNEASPSVVEVESVQRSSHIKSVFERRSQNKKKRSHFPETAKNILSSFYSKNPYPEKNDIANLAYRAKLTPKQIRIWFNNKRNREESSDIHVSNPSTAKNPIPKLTRSSLDSLDKTFHQSERKSESPVSIDRYLATALEDDAVASNIIGHSFHNSQSPDMDQLSLKALNSSRPSSVYSGKSSVGTNVSGKSFTTCASHQSLRSIRTTTSVYSSASRASRRGRRKLAALTRRLTPGRHKIGPKLFCTFCGDEFRGKNEWKRHEQTVHMPQKAWVCNCTQLLSPARDLCPYDLHPSPTDEHLAQHNHFSCTKAPEAERTFFRKDKLVQHLRRTHRMTENALAKLKAKGTLNNWEAKPSSLLSDDVALRCGFCGLQLRNWDLRVEHIYEHLLEGKSRVDWWPTRRWHTQRSGLQPIFRTTLLGSVECVNCGAKFRNILNAKSSHKSCPIVDRDCWSCSFLSEISGLVPYVLTVKRLCSLCDRQLPIEFNDPESLEKILDHLSTNHNIRGCNQRLFFKEWEFENHLKTEHNASYGLSISILEHYWRRLLSLL